MTIEKKISANGRKSWYLNGAHTSKKAIESTICNCYRTYSGEVVEISRQDATYEFSKIFVRAPYIVRELNIIYTEDKAEIEMATDADSKVKALFANMKNFNFGTVGNLDMKPLCSFFDKLYYYIEAAENQGFKTAGFRFDNEGEQIYGNVFDIANNQAQDAGAQWHVAITHDLYSLSNYNRRAMQHFINYILTNNSKMYDRIEWYLEKAGINSKPEDFCLAIDTVEVIAETDGYEDDPDDQNDVFNYLPAIESLNDVDTTQSVDEMKAAADKMGLMQLNRKIADLEEQLIDNRLAATAVLNEITDDTTFAEQKEIERRYSKYAAISDALIDEKAIYKAAKSTRLSQITAIKNLMSKNQNTSGTKEPPALDIDDKEFFNTQAAFIDATIQHNLAERDLHTAKDKFAAAENAQFDAKQKLQNAANKIVKQLDNIIVNVFIPAKKTMTLITQDDNEQIKTDFSQFTITYYEGFRLANHHDYCATYDTPAEIRTIFAKLQAAIERGDEEFTFPTVDELNTPPEMPPCAPKSPDITAEEILPINDENPPKNAYDAQIAQINKNAPANWSVSFDTDKNNFPVNFKDKTITTLDSLALAKILPPEKFFEQFRPLVDKNYSHKQQFIDDRRKELAALQDMRKLIVDDAERLKSIDDMIDNIKRDLLEISLE